MRHGGPSLYNELIKVPLIVWEDGADPRGTVNRPTSSVDIAPTILSYLGVVADTPMEGEDLLSSATESGPDKAVFAQWGNRRYAIITEDWKLIQDLKLETLELYRWSQDHGERIDLSGEMPEVRDRLLARLEAWRADLAATAVEAANQRLTKEQVDRLKSLGYLQ